MEMKEIEGINIVCPGSWNKRLFTPAWVATNLFELEKNEIQAVFNPFELDMGYPHNGVVLLPKDNSLEIKFEKINDETKKYGITLLNQIITLLPQTPIRAIGFNIRYLFKKEEDVPFVEKLNQINCPLNDFHTSQVKFTKYFDEYQLNIIVDLNEEEYPVNFNFHYKFSDLPEGFNFGENILFDKIKTTQNVIENG